MSLEVALGVLKFARDNWYKIPEKDRKKMLQAIKDKDVKTAVLIAAKYHLKFKNPRQKPIHCRICSKAIRGTSGKTFSVRMKKLRNHRKRMHKK